MGLKTLSIWLLALHLGSAGIDEAINIGKADSLSEECTLEENVKREINNCLDPDSIRLYQTAGVSQFSTIDYLHFLGISPETVLGYVNEGVFETSDIIKQEFSRGAISQNAKELFNYYNIKHPERYDSKIVKQLLDSRNGENNNKPGLFIFFDEENLQKKVNEEKITLEFSEDLMTGDVKKGYAGKFYNPDANLMIFEIDNNPNLRDNVRQAKQKFDEYHIGGVFVLNSSEGLYSFDFSALRILELFFGDGDWSTDEDTLLDAIIKSNNLQPPNNLQPLNSVLLDAIFNSDDLKLAEEYVEVGVDDTETLKYLEILGITPARIKENLKYNRTINDIIMSECLFDDGGVSEEDKRVFAHYSIYHPESLNVALFKELKQNMEGIPDDDGKQIAVVLVGQDYHGEGFELGNFEKLLKGYHLLIYEVSDDDAAIKRITEAGNKYGKIDLLWILSHSGRNSIAFLGYGDSSELDINEIGKIKKISPYVGKDSIIVLDGCNNAKGGKKAHNISRAIHDVTGAKVYGTGTQTYECVAETQEDGKVIGVICDGKKAVEF